MPKQYRRLYQQWQDDEYEQLTELAKRERSPVAAVIRRAVRHYIKCLEAGIIPQAPVE